MVIMAIDLGDSRTGISLCDKNEILSYPLCTLVEKVKHKLVDKISNLAKEHSVESIILGFPRNMNGSIGNKAKEIISFKNSLLKKVKVNVILWDERLTTVSAQRNFAYMNINSKKFKKIIDSASACLILENYLEYKHARELNS